MKPFVTAVQDYHDFEDVIRHFKNAGIKLDFVEVGCGHSEYWKDDYAGYHAVFYQGVRPQSLVKKWKKQIEECYEN